jgi:hypothetical protein
MRAGETVSSQCIAIDGDAAAEVASAFGVRRVIGEVPLAFEVGDSGMRGGGGNDVEDDAAIGPWTERGWRGAVGDAGVIDGLGAGRMRAGLVVGVEEIVGVLAAEDSRGFEEAGEGGDGEFVALGVTMSGASSMPRRRPKVPQ